MASLSYSSIGALIAGLLAVAVVGSGCSSSDSLPSARADNPLPECPDSPNCERVSVVYEIGPERLFDSARQALKALDPAELQLQPNSRRASAADRVAWMFTDDVDVAVQAHQDSSVLHVRSASRTGYSDLGVNRRRVQRLLSAVDDQIAPE